MCGAWATFADMSTPIRETYQCGQCRASMRERVMAEAILAVFGRATHTSLSTLVDDPRFAGLHIFEPGIAGAYRRLFRPLPHYANSFYWEDADPGEMRDGVRNEDLMNLTFESDSLDLVLSSDIFEHVRRPWQGFEEIWRVLRPGGFHIFTVPSLVPMPPKTLYRVDTTTDFDIHLKDPHYHGDGAGGRSLVYTEFGTDLFDRLADIGFDVWSVRADHADAERSRVNAFAARARKPGA